MAIDFKKKISQKNIEKKINPKEIYETLDRKSNVGPMRPAQELILSEWYNHRRNDEDLIIKLHTGEGKTLIGLLLLQSQLNAYNEPCIYVTPNKYLAKQVCAEAEKFGIQYCTIENNTLPTDFETGKKILITHAQKLFNGLSIFGLYNNSIKINSIVLDDSHSCIDIIQNAFSITIKSTDSNDCYNKILSLFEDELMRQKEGSFLDIKNGDYETIMLVPYWELDNKKTELLKILQKYKETNNEIKFSWHLIRDQIINYYCIVSGTKIEISPYQIDINAFGTFNNAKHKILMSATTQDDIFFIKSLNFSPKTIQNPLTDNTKKWSGEKMIIIPSLIHDDLDHNSMVAFFSRRRDKFGVVSLVPSSNYLMPYEKMEAIITTSNNISEELNKLKQDQFSKLVVINNRYDGIDLPDNSCRILIIDSLPYFDRLSERYEQQVRTDNDFINKKIAQKIEQGIGRGVRGEKDYCAIIIIGNKLVQFIYSKKTNKFLSAQTQKQIEIGLEIAKLSKEEWTDEIDPKDNIKSLIDQLLTRDEGWKEYYSLEMNNITQDKNNTSTLDILTREKEIEKLFLEKKYYQAVLQMKQFLDQIKLSSIEKGWYLQQLARYQYYAKLDDYNLTQKRAFELNRQLLYSVLNIDYAKLKYINENRIKNIIKFITNYKDHKELKLNIKTILDDLTFGNNAKKFESALQQLGELLGFISQRPDNEFRVGPDNLWCGNDNKFLLFECKNEVDEDRETINKKEANQMLSHCTWFESEYGINVTYYPFLIINTKKLAQDAVLNERVKIIKKAKLKILKKNIINFIDSLHKYELGSITVVTLQEKLDLYKLNIQDFVELYSENYSH